MTQFNMIGPAFAADKQSGAVPCDAPFLARPQAFSAVLFATFAQYLGPEDMAEECADPAPNLAIDGSGSSGMAEHATQIEGCLAALTSPEIRRASAKVGHVEVGAVIWGDDAMQGIAIPLRAVDHPNVPDALADELHGAGRHVLGNSGLGPAIGPSLALLADPGPFAVPRVSDVSGGGRNSCNPAGPLGSPTKASLSPEAARTRAAAPGATVNGRALLNGGTWLAEEDPGNVITGAGAFATAVDGFETFEPGLVRILVREIEHLSLSALSERSP